MTNDNEHKKNIDPRVLAYLAYVEKLQLAVTENPIRGNISLEEFEKIDKLIKTSIIEKVNREKLLEKNSIQKDDPTLKDDSDLAYNKKTNLLSLNEKEFMKAFFKNHGILSRNRKMLYIFERIVRFRKGIEVIITGETGTGKEGIAKAFHRLSKRPGKLRVVNAAEMTGDLFKDKLMGHVKGAFAGAYEPRAGEIELAHNGTLFLDEIGDIDPEIQEELLRVLQEKTVQRDGSPKIYKVNFRLLSATNKNISNQIKLGKMRSDFAARIASGVSIELPPIKDRLSDVPLLAHHFFVKELSILQKEDNTENEPMKEYKPGIMKSQEDIKLDNLSFEIKPDDFNFLMKKNWSEWNIRGLEKYIRKVATAVDSLFGDISQLDKLSFFKLLEDPDADLDEFAKLSKYKSNQNYKLFKLLAENKYRDDPTSENSDDKRDVFIRKINTVILQIGRDVSYRENSICDIIISLLVENHMINRSDLESYIRNKLSQLVNANILTIGKLYFKKEAPNAIKELKQIRVDLISN
ncbi:MAG: sigma-54-dependent Fis family transcriptional regulator [Bacteroidetes bacterium]|nr:sigma-54-dependent Fis family transcriptional regulator [Bacteroidota bacterium]